MKSLICSLLVLGVVGQAYSSCPQLEPVAGYTDNDLLKDWTLLGHTDKSDPSFHKLKCEVMYAYKEGSTYHLTGTGIDIATNTKIANWTETGEMKEKPGQFYYVNPKYGNFFLTVIGKTDHAVVMYSCEFPFNGTPYVWIYHTDPKSNIDALAAGEKAAITNILTSHGIEVNSVKYHDNTSC